MRRFPLIVTSSLIFSSLLLSNLTSDTGLLYALAHYNLNKSAVSVSLVVDDPFCSSRGRLFSLISNSDELRRSSLPSQAAKGDLLCRLGTGRQGSRTCPFPVSTMPPLRLWNDIFGPPPPFRLFGPYLSMLRLRPCGFSESKIT